MYITIQHSRQPPLERRAAPPKIAMKLKLGSPPDVDWIAYRSAVDKALYAPFLLSLQDVELERLQERSKKADAEAEAMRCVAAVCCTL
eukprot:461523-Pelagomonas_calceolata.AAC.4